MGKTVRGAVDLYWYLAGSTVREATEKGEERKDKGEGGGGWSFVA